MTLSRFIAAILLVILASSAAAQQQAPQPLPVQFSIDHATFAYGDDNSLVEVYLAFEAMSLPFEPSDGNYGVRLPLDITVVPASDQVLPGTPVDPVWADSLFLRFAVADTSVLAPGQHFLHQMRFAVPPGEYQLRARIPADDEQERREIEVRVDMLVPNFAERNAATLSDVTLASSIERSDREDNPFYKNGLIIRPNASQLYGQGLGAVYYYAEAYNTESLAGDEESYTLFAYVAEANRAQPIDSLQRRLQRPAESPDVLVGSFDVSTLPSGSYFLRLVLLNDAFEAVAEQVRKFFVYNPGVQRQVVSQATMTFDQSAYAAMSEEEVAIALDQIDVIATGAERNTIDELSTLDARRRFLMRFWQKRDPEPSTLVNEYKVRFERLVNYAQERYGNNFAEGWESDRGRVLLKYGRPAHIEPHLYERNSSPYEIWVYNDIAGEGRAQFIFADTEGFGSFDLLHSTATGERKMRNWRQRLRQN